jgi:valyl-tRNA synthetase
MPFITEEIWQALPHEGEALMIEKYPEYTEALSYPEEEAGFELIMKAIRAVRARRAEMNVPPSKKPHLFIVPDKADIFETGRSYLGRLAYAGEVTISGETPENADKMVTIVTDDAKLYMPLAELVDLDKEKERINKELKKANDELARVEGKLGNEKFTSRAPEAVVNAEREKLEKAKALIANLTEALNELNQIG